MTENNVIKFFQEQADFVKNNHSFYPPNEIYEILFEMINELHQYRAIGTVEECRVAIENKFTKPPSRTNKNDKRELRIEQEAEEWKEF